MAKENNGEFSTENTRQYGLGNKQIKEKTYRVRTRTSLIVTVIPTCWLVSIGLVMCRLGLEALSRPKPALESRARPEPC